MICAAFREVVRVTVRQGNAHTLLLNIWGSDENVLREEALRTCLEYCPSVPWQEKSHWYIVVNGEFWKHMAVCCVLESPCLHVEYQDCRFVGGIWKKVAALIFRTVHGIHSEC